MVLRPESYREATIIGSGEIVRALVPQAALHTALKAHFLISRVYKYHLFQPFEIVKWHGIPRLLSCCKDVFGFAKNRADSFKAATAG